MSYLANDFFNNSLPRDGGTIAVPSAASSTAGDGDLSSYIGKHVWLKADVKTHIRVGTSYEAATAGDIYLTPDVDYDFRVAQDQKHISVYGAGAGTLYLRVTSGPI